MVPSFRQFLFGPVSTSGTVLRGVRRIDSYDQTTSTFSLHRQGVAELRPRSIGDRFSKAVVLYHAFDIEFFDGKDTEAIDEFARLLMHEVMTTVFDTLMDAPNDLLCGFTFFGAVLVFHFVELALCFGKSRFFLTEETRVLNELTIGQGRKGFQSNVNADRIRAFGETFGFVFAGEANVPLFAIFTNRAGLDCARTGAMYLGLYLPNFGECDRTFSNTVSALRVGDTVVLAFAFEPGVSRFFSCLDTAEKGLKSEFDTDGDILQHLTMNRRQFGMRRLPCCDSLLLLIDRWRLALRFIADGSLVNKAVIDITADSQRLIERSLLRVIGVYSIFYTNLVHTYIIPKYNVKYSKRDINQVGGICRHRNDDELSIPVAKARGLPRFYGNIGNCGRRG